LSVKFQDYYQTLEVSRTASQEEISKAFRKLARKYHPDVNKDPSAESKFKQLNEAYEVLKDPEKRARYDQLGENWKAGQDFQAPPGWENIFQQFSQGQQTQRAQGGRRGPQTATFQFGGGSGFSDFFDTLFGGNAGFGGNEGFTSQRTGVFERDGESQSASINIPLEDAYHGASKSISITTTERNAQGLAELKKKNLKIKIPPGSFDGRVIRLKGMGGKGSGGGADGDLLLTVHITPNAAMQLEGNNIVSSLPISPWEAALGAKVPVQTLEGTVSVSVPPGSQTGQRLRLRGKGFPAAGGAKGDLLVELKIMVPTTLTEHEKQAFNELASTSTFNPRS
jgi:curved DNA-binding protein